MLRVYQRMIMVKAKSLYDEKYSYPKMQYGGVRGGGCGDGSDGGRVSRCSDSGRRVGEWVVVEVEGLVAMARGDMLARDNVEWD